MKWIILLTLVAGIFFVYLLIQAIEDGDDPEDGSVLSYPDEEIFSEFEGDKHSPEHLKTDSILKVLSLRQKLNEIEKEREIDDININYQNYWKNK